MYSPPRPLEEGTDIVFLEDESTWQQIVSVKERRVDLGGQAETVEVEHDTRSEREGVSYGDETETIWVNVNTFLTKYEPFDYKSYSYRLIGHIYACEEDYEQAEAALKLATELSPDYEDGNYDYAQYCALLREKDKCLTALRKAISDKSLYFYLAQKERNFDPLRHEVQILLNGISTEASEMAKEAILRAENALDKAEAAIPTASVTLEEEKVAIGSKEMHKLLRSRLNDTEKWLSGGKELLSFNGFVSFLTRLMDVKAALEWAEKEVIVGSSSMYQDARSKLSFLQKESEALLNRIKEDLRYEKDSEKMFKQYARRKLESGEFAQIVTGLKDLKEGLNKPGEVVFESGRILTKAESQLDAAKAKVASGDYTAFFEAKAIAEESENLGNRASEEAHKERKILESNRLI
jgi:tetratricopeptide (TPR) repeat protein